jgi:type VI secretion system secreted protein VgrG
MHQLIVDGLGPPLRVVRLEGYEALSQAFQLEVTVALDEHELWPASVVGRTASLALDVGGGARLFHGIVGRFGHGDAGEARAEYQVTLVPAVWRTRLRTDSRIFQGLTVPEIVADVLGRAGFLRFDPRSRERRDRAQATGFQLALGSTYRARDYCVQYRESDWDFVNRLLEEEGIHYFFEHHDASHLLFVTDAAMGHEPLSDGDALSFRPSSGALRAGEHVSRFHFAEEARPTRVVVTDYSFERPRLGLTAAAGDGALEVFEHPGDHDLPQTGADMAKLRLAEILASRWTGRGESNAGRLAPGRTITLTDHPSAELNRSYLVTRVEHRIVEEAGGGTYACRFEVVPADVAYVPPRRTPRPVIQGLQTAVVVGPAGEEIHTDDLGRVKVRFHWDRSGLGDDRCSAWIRVAQASAGGGFGALFLPRVGHEVVVDFLEGDPDRPLVTGAVYHAANVPPYALPAEKTKSTLKTASSGGGGGSNELRFEDRAGSEEVYLHAERDLAFKAEHDQTEHVGHDRTRYVGNDEDITVGANRTARVLAVDTEEVALAQNVLVGAAQTITVGAARMVTVGGFMSVNVGLFKNELVGGVSAEQVGGRKTTYVRHSYFLTARTGVTIKSLQNAFFHAKGHLKEEAGKDFRILAGHDLSAHATSSIAIEAAKGMIGVEALKGSIGIEAAQGIRIAVTGGQVTEATAARTLVVGAGVSITCKGSVIHIDKEGNIRIEGKAITVVGKGAIKVKGTTVDING